MSTTTQPIKNNIAEIFRTKNAADLVAFAERMGEKLARGGLTASQIRNILDSIQAMHKYDPNQIQLLRPKLAYAAGKKREVKEFREILEEAIACVNEDNFKFFRSFVEAIVAYHTLAEAKIKEEKKREGSRR